MIVPLLQNDFTDKEHKFIFKNITIVYIFWEGNKNMTKSSNFS